MSSRRPSNSNGDRRRSVFTKLIKNADATMRDRHQAIRFIEGMESFESKLQLLSRLDNDREYGTRRMQDVISFINSTQDVSSILIRLLKQVMNDETNRPLHRPLRDKILFSIYQVPGLLEGLVEYNVAKHLDHDAAETLCLFLRAVTKPYMEARKSESIQSLATSLRIRGDVHEASVLCTFLLVDEKKEVAAALRYDDDEEQEIRPTVACWVTDMDPPGGRHDNDELNYRDIKIVPTAEELSCTIKPYLPLASGENRFIDDPMAALLDRNFRLLREDAVSSMRENLADWEMKSWKHARLIDLNVYTKGKNWSVSFVIQFDKRSSGNIDWEKSRSLAKGSVIALCQQGRPVRLGTIVIREHDAIGQWLNDPHGPKIGVSFELESDFDNAIEEVIKNCAINTTYCKLREIHKKLRIDDLRRAKLEDQIAVAISQLEIYDLVEISKSFFAYRPILKTLQEMETIPLSNELLGEEQSAILKPDYLPDVVTLPEDAFNGVACDLNAWSIDEVVSRTSLDSSQASALIKSLTSRVSLTQGPPGTGKTFLGALVARVIRDNSDATILCVCYTNHALDQFLDHMLDAGEKRMVRIGGRSKSERLAGYKLKELARSKNRETDTVVQRRIRQVHAILHKLKEEIQKCVEAFKASVEWTEPNGGISEFLDYERPDISSFLLVPGAEDQDGFKIVGQRGKPVDKDYLWDCWRKGDRFPQWMLPHMDIEDYCRDSFNEFWNMSAVKRAEMVESWRQELLQPTASVLSQALLNFTACSKENLSLCHERELEVLRDARIIGATTSGAASHHDLLSALSPEVVLVEEAGEVLESHILTSLSTGSVGGSDATKHLILIGDHKQLPPKVESHELTTTSGNGYNLDCSLFERLCCVQGISSVSLEVQHRMRPTISALVRSQTYPSLKDHESVTKYPAIKGVTENLLFIDHKQMEDAADTDNSTTKTNKYEAELCLQIVRFLLLQGYSAEQVVILTPYLGQLLTIKALMTTVLSDATALLSERDIEDLEELEAPETPVSPSGSPRQNREKKQAVRCSSIDNYQGEEADIVVISLVRSNRNGNIGFLKERQRVNVLLSRARHGMFIVGNATTLMSSVKGRGVWEPILNQLKSQGRVLNGLPTTCQLHPSDEPVILSHPKDFQSSRPNGGCLRPCTFRLSCGHACPLKCHPTDRSHNAAQRRCCEPCPRFPQGCSRHLCTRLCKDDCGPCLTEVCSVKLPCGHEAAAAKCYEVGSTEALEAFSLRCAAEVRFKFQPCGHEASTTCANTRRDQPECPELCGKLCHCGHPCRIRCGSCDDKHDCKQVCSRTLFCGHACGRPCHSPKRCGPCQGHCTARCSHSSCPKLCSIACASCVERCDWWCPHKGQCDFVCGAPCSRLPCNKRCEEKLECGHRCPSFCGEVCPTKEFCAACGLDKHRDHVVDIISMTAYCDHDVDEDPIVFLQCGHFYAASTLDGHIEMSKVYQLDESGSWGSLKSLKSSGVKEKLKQCPDCRSVIHSVRRYGRILKLVELRALERKHMATSNQSLQNIEEQLLQAPDRGILTQIGQLEKDIRRSPMRRVFEACGGHKAMDLSHPPAAPLMRCLELKGVAHGQFAASYDDDDFRAAKGAYLAAIGVADDSRSLSSGAKLRLALARLVLKLCLGVDSVLSEVSSWLDWILEDSGLPLTSDAVNDARMLKKELEQASLDKIKEVMAAMSNELDGYNYGVGASDHWYECPNGHPYFIGECGGAMQETRCPECNEPIGGRSHSLVATNRPVQGRFRDALSG